MRRWGRTFNSSVTFLPLSAEGTGSTVLEGDDLEVQQAQRHGGAHIRGSGRRKGRIVI